MQAVPPTEPVEEGEEGEWDIVEEPTGSRSPAPTVEELLAQLERQPSAPQGSTEPAAAAAEEVIAVGAQGALHRLLLLEEKQQPQRRKRRRPPKLDW
jgi:hypothetical protein